MDDITSNIDELTLDEIRRFITYKNPNNFDEYYARVLPKSSK